MKLASVVSCAIALSFLAAPSFAAAPTKPVLTLEMAKSIMAVAEAKAKELNAPGGAIAIVDDGGHVILTERLDGTFPAAATVSIGKARTAAIFRKPTSVFENVINKGRTAMAALPDTVLTPLQGGVPLIVDGQVVGAIGMSGAASAAQDEEIANAAAQSVH